MIIVVDILRMKIGYGYLKDRCIVDIGGNVFHTVLNFTNNCGNVIAFGHVNII